MTLSLVNTFFIDIPGFPLEIALLLLCMLHCLFCYTLCWCALVNISVLFDPFMTEAIIIETSPLMDWFLYDNGLHHERFKCLLKMHSFNHSGQQFFLQLKVTRASSRLNQRNFSQNSFSRKRSQESRNWKRDMLQETV